MNNHSKLGIAGSAVQPVQPVLPCQSAGSAESGHKFGVGWPGSGRVTALFFGRARGGPGHNTATM